MTKTLNTIIPTINDYEGYEKEINAIYLYLVKTGATTLEQGDLETVYEIANTCPTRGGISTHKARSLYMQFVADSDPLWDLCEEGTTAERSDDNVEIIKEEEFILKLMPNPTNTSVSFDAVEDGSVWQIVSLEGKVLQSGKSLVGTNRIDVSELNSGIYFFCLQANSLQTKKLVIQK